MTEVPAAVCCGGGWVSNSELVGRVATVATALTELGVRHKEPVLLLMPDGPDFIDAFVGVLECKAVPLPLSPMLSAGEVAANAADADARLVLVSATRISALAELAVEPPVLLEGPQGMWAALLRILR